jgi:hydrophobic/amphiphilic exporter-1 (mainly G- bacteria), HAE1 family
VRIAPHHERIFSFTRLAKGILTLDPLAAFRSNYSQREVMGRSAAGCASTGTVTVAGRGRELERTFREFGWAFLLSIIFTYMVLASQYESVWHPLVILLSLPLSLPFAMLSLWATRNTLNLYSAFGMSVLFGVVAKNAILQVDHARNLREQGMQLRTAVLQASRDRLRPS